MPRFEVLLVVESSNYYYVEAEDGDAAIDLAKDKFETGYGDENPACGWAKVTDASVQTLAENETKDGSA